MAIFHLSIRPISRAKGHSAVAQIAYDTRCKLTDDRTGQKHDWSKHKHDVIEWQIIGPKMTPGELAARAEQAERRWDARVGRAMDVALPHELNPKAQWDLLRGFGLQLRDEYGAALCVSLHHPNTKGDQRNAHGHIFMTSRAVDENGDSAKTKIRSLDDRKLGLVEVERIREMWEVRCNRALRKAGLSEDVTRHSLKAQGIDRPATQHLGPKASAMTRNGCRLWKTETNREIFSASRRMAEIDLLEIIPSRGLHIRTRQESWVISLPEELQSDELLKAITSGEVNCLSGSCEPFEQSSESSKSSSSN